MEHRKPIPKARPAAGSVFLRPSRLLLCGALLVAGCRNCDLVEAELRTKDNELRALRDELHHAEACNDSLQRELHAVHPPTTAAAVSPEFASQAYTVKELVLGRLTGGYDGDGCPGDEALQVVLEPRDCDGHAIKAPGTLHVEAIQVSPEGLKIPLSSWDVPPNEMRRAWRTGFLSTGYSLVLPWKVWPEAQRLRVVARFTLPDGRVFEAEKDVTIRLTPITRRPPAPPAPSDADTPLPLPQPIPQAPGAQGPVIEPAFRRGSLKPATPWQLDPPTVPSPSVRLLPPVHP
jgi:hypothetical protein